MVTKLGSFEGCPDASERCERVRRFARAAQKGLVGWGELVARLLGQRGRQRTEHR